MEISYEIWVLSFPTLGPDPSVEDVGNSTYSCEYPEYYEKNYEMLYKKECRKNNSKSTWTPLLQLSLLVQKTYKSINYFCSIIQKKTILLH